MWQGNLCGKGGKHGRGHVCWGPCVSRAGWYTWQGVHGRGAGGVWQGACMVGVVNAGETATEAGSKHPTGMHSCLHFHAVLSKTLAK